jgi:hypothetical protein
MTNLIRTGLESNPALIKVYNVCNVQISRTGNTVSTVNTSLADRGVGFNERPYASRVKLTSLDILTDSNIVVFIQRKLARHLLVLLK